MKTELEPRSGQAFQRRWTVGRKIGGLAAMLMLMPLTALVIVGKGISSVGDELTEIAAIDIPLTRLLAEIEAHELHQHVFLEKLLRIKDSGGTAAESERARRDFEQAGEQVRERWRKADALVREAAESSAHGAAQFRQTADALSRLEFAHQAFCEHAREFLDDSSDNEDIAAVTQALEREAAEVDTCILAILGEVEDFTEESIGDADEHEATALQVSIVATLLTALVGIVLSVVIIRALTRSVGQLSENALRIAQGDLTVSEVEVSSSDEVGEMAHAFNDMLVSLRHQVTETRAAVDTVTAATSQILVSAQQQSASTREQAATVQEITSTMQEIGQSGAQMAERAQQVSTTAETSRRAGESGLDAVQQNAQSLESIREQVEAVAENIVLLSEKTQAVGEIITAVNDIDRAVEPAGTQRRHRSDDGRRSGQSFRGGRQRDEAPGGARQGVDHAGPRHPQ